MLFPGQNSVKTRGGSRHRRRRCYSFLSTSSGGRRHHRRQNPEREVFGGHDRDDLAAGGAERPEEHSFAEPLEVDVAPAPTSTSGPVVRLKRAMSRIASTTRPTMRSIVCCTNERSSEVTLGKRSTTVRWNADQVAGAR
jgi:hypothetical protein